MSFDPNEQEQEQLPENLAAEDTTEVPAGVQEGVQEDSTRGTPLEEA